MEKSPAPKCGQHHLLAIQVKRAQPKEDYLPSPPLPFHLACLNFRFTVALSRFTVLLLLIPLPITESLGCYPRLPLLPKDQSFSRNFPGYQCQIGTAKAPARLGYSQVCSLSGKPNLLLLLLCIYLIIFSIYSFNQFCFSREPQLTLSQSLIDTNPEE